LEEKVEARESKMLHRYGLEKIDKDEEKDSFDNNALKHYKPSNLP